jgi:putative addiction module component (TIGR02574 family)
MILGVKLLWRYSAEPAISIGMSLSLLEIKKEIAALPKEQKRELTGDLVEEISAEDFPVADASLDEVHQRLEDYRQDPSKVTTLDEIEARIRNGRSRA